MGLRLPYIGSCASQYRGIADAITSLIETVLPGQKPLSDAELVASIMGLIVAGHETLTRLIGNGLVHLLEEPERWQKLCKHPEDIPLVIEEIIRYHGPVRGFMRTMMGPATVGGVSLPAGTKLFLIYSSANRDLRLVPGQRLAHKPDLVNYGYQRVEVLWKATQPGG